MSKYNWKNLKTSTQPRFKKQYEAFNKALRKSGQRPSAVEMAISESMFLKKNTVPSSVAQILLDDIEALEVERDEALEMKGIFNRNNLNLKKDLKEFSLKYEKLRSAYIELQDQNKALDQDLEEVENQGAFFAKVSNINKSQLNKNASVMKVIVDLVERSNISEQLEGELEEKGLSMQDVQVAMRDGEEQVAEEVKAFREELSYE